MGSETTLPRMMLIGYLARVQRKPPVISDLTSNIRSSTPVYRAIRPENKGDTGRYTIDIPRNTIDIFQNTIDISRNTIDIP